MPRSQHPNRNTARAIVSDAAGMRDFHRRPDSIPVTVLGRHTDGRYIVKRDSWPYSIYAPAIPPDAVIPYPLRMRMDFEEGDNQRPFLYWPKSAPFVLPNVGGAGILDWVSQFATFTRANGLTPDFDAGGASEVVAALNTAPFNLRAAGSTLAYCNVDGGFRLVLGAETIFQFEFGNPINPDPAIMRLTWDGEAAYLVYGDDALVLPKWMVRFTAAGSKTWEVGLFTGGGITSDAIIDEDRILVAGEVPSGGEDRVQVAGWDAATFANVVVGAPIVNRESTTFWDGTWQVLGECFRGDSQTFLIGDRLIAPGKFGQVHCFDKATLALQWTAPNEAGKEYRLISPIGQFGSRLLCAFEHHEFYEVTDQRAAHDFDSPTLEPQLRTQYEEGLSLYAGLCTLDLSTGETVAEVVFEGTAANGQHYGPYTDLVINESSDSFPVPGGGPGQGNEYWASVGQPYNTFSHFLNWYPGWELSNPEWDGSFLTPLSDRDKMQGFSEQSAWEALVDRETARINLLKTLRPEGYQLLGRAHRRRAPWYDTEAGYQPQRLTLMHWPIPLGVRDPDPNDPFGDWEEPDTFRYDPDTRFTYFQNIGSTAFSGYSFTYAPQEQIDDPEAYPGNYVLAWSGSLATPPEEEGDSVDFEWKSWFRSGQELRLQTKTVRPEVNLTVAIPFAGKMVIGPDGLAGGNVWTAYSSDLSTFWTFTYTLFDEDLAVQLPVVTGSTMQILVLSDTLGPRLLTLDSSGAKINERAANGFAPLMFDGTNLWLDDGTSRWEP